MDDRTNDGFYPGIMLFVDGRIGLHQNMIFTILQIPEPAEMDHIFKKLNRYFYGKWHFAVLDLEKGRWIRSAKLSNIAYLKSQNAQNRHILIQPLKDIFGFYFIADDLTWDIIQKHHCCCEGLWKPGRMIVETSPSNYQVWIHSSRYLSLEEKRYWLKKMGSDPGADPNNRWGRCPGFRNRKDKYKDEHGYYPLAKLIWIDWKHQAVIPNIFTRTSGYALKRHLPVSRCDYHTGNESSTDISYAMALLYRGYSNLEIKHFLINERTQWENHRGTKRKQNYLDRTIKKARFYFEQNKNRR